MGKWITYDPLCCDDSGTYSRRLPHGPGCYAIYLDHKLWYIGQSKNVAQRLDAHGVDWWQFSNTIKSPWGDRFKHCFVKVRVVDKYGDWAMHELRMIRRLRPKGNIAHNRKAVASA